MTPDGRSLDDLPLAAYSTGMEPDPRMDEPEPGPDLPVPDSMPDGVQAPGPARAEPTGDAQPMAVPESTAGTRGGFPVWLAHPRAHLRDPRLLLSMLIGFGIVLLAVSLLTGGGGALGPAAAASPSPAPSVNPTPEPGEAALVLEGAAQASLSLRGGGGAAAVGDPFSATWTDPAGTSLTLQGRVDRGTRTTGEDLSLSIVVMVEGAPVTFASTGGECTVGMATQPGRLTGSLSCHDLRSPDGKLTLDASGTYRT